MTAGRGRPSPSAVEGKPETLPFLRTLTMKKTCPLSARGPPLRPKGGCDAGAGRKAGREVPHSIPAVDRNATGFTLKGKGAQKIGVRIACPLRSALCKAALGPRAFQKPARRPLNKLSSIERIFANLDGQVFLRVRQDGLRVKHHQGFIDTGIQHHEKALSCLETKL